MAVATLPSAAPRDYFTRFPHGTQNRPGDSRPPGAPRLSR
ncbi:hypothetical protein M2388_000741 [Leucobacter aridicollis]|nr:hypothetical protein [Leucobacter aridicollis]